jgi:hypothetical protein
VVRECGGVVVAGLGLGIYRPRVAHGEVPWTLSMATLAVVFSRREQAREIEGARARLTDVDRGRGVR